MPVVFIQFTQDGVEFPVGNAEVSFDKMGLPVSCSLEDGTGVTSYLWSLIYKPEGSEAVISNEETATAEFTPDVEGTYMVQVVVDELYTDAKYFGVKTQVFDTRIPYPGETVDDGTTGWSEEVNTCLRKLSSVSGRTAIVCENIDAVDIEYGDVVISDGTLTALGRLGVYLATPALIASINPDIAMIGISTGDTLTRGTCEPLGSLNSAFYGGTVNGLTISGEAPLSYPWKVCIDPAVPGGLTYDVESSYSHIGYALDSATVSLKSKQLSTAYQNVLYVGKHGSDDNDGKTPDKAFLTFTAAIAAAVALTPSITNKFAIRCQDAGDYTENITLASYIFIHAPSARLIGNIVLNDSSLAIFERGAASSGVWCSKLTGSGAAHIEVKRLVCSDGAHGIACLSGELEANFVLIEVADGVAIGEATGGAAYMRATGSRIIKSGTPLSAVMALNSVVLELNINRIEVSGATTAIMASGGSSAINGMVGDIVAAGGTAINSGSGCSICLLNAIYSGAVTETGTVRLMSAQNISRDGTFTSNSDLLLPTQKAVKTYVDAYWSSRMHYLTSAAEITAAFADTSPGYHNYVVAPVSYMFTADILKAPGRSIKYAPGVSFTMNNDSKITLGRVAGTDFLGQWDTKCTINAVTGVITGSSATLGGAFDWSGIASQPGAKLFTRGMTFDIESWTANTITPPAGQIVTANPPYEYDTACPCTLIVPASNIEVSGEVNLIAGAGHSGKMIDLLGAVGCNFGGWRIRPTLPATITEDSPFDMRWMSNGQFPQILLNNQSCAISGFTTMYLFNLSFCHNMKVERFEIYRNTFAYNDAAATYASMVVAGLSSYVTAQRGAIESFRNYFYDLQGSTNLTMADIQGAYMTGIMTHDRGTGCDGTRTDELTTGAIGWSTTTTDCYN